MTSEATGRPGDWRSILRIYLHPRVIAMLFLGFSAGLPFLLVAGTLTAWLAIAEVSMAEIGMFAWVGIAYSLKFLWAPLVDRMPLPGLTTTLGRRRGWMLLAQLGVIAGLLGFAASDPATNLAGVAAFALLAAFASATQDIAIDAYRIEAVELRLQGAMAATYQAGYRIAVLAAGAGALVIADMASWELAYQTMAALMLIGVITVLVIAEPETAVPPAVTDQTQKSLVRLSHWFAEAVIGPFAEFFRRNGRAALLLLMFIGFYRVSDMVLGVMANPFYIDIGFTLKEIAAITKVFGVVVTLSGAALGGVAVARYGLNGPLVFGAVLLAVTNLFFAAMAAYGPELWFLVLTISADNLAAGFTGTVFIAYLSGLTNVAYTATQYALFSSLMTLPGKFISGFSGQIVEAVDWFSFFVYASAMGLPAVILAVMVTRRPQASA
ncbi:MAG: MFS transporter [Gammaproteobacteria bacterium]|nr:MFS transporter [Gammaproteobacteria bacterium]